ncbi:PQQ-dependent sugar dehydrogenase [Halorhabdus amylolytica]|uniref:PQQ-dependent sugar dehydrogenase n=1 Tax=Halorhabdus amylolytica TaxID=2559573 RepID=UPI0010AB1E9E|nr:PQQ-dependent sugar dehydrogenase [Halorhabdus amylolytica]
MRSRLTRRELLASGATALGVGIAGCTDRSETTTDRTTATITADGSGTIPPGDGTGLPDSVGVELVASGFTAPIALAFLDEETLLVADQAGVVRVVTDGRLREQPLLDVRDGMVSLSGYEERGLLGIALHPDYPDDPRLFVRYSASPRDGTPDSYSHTFVLSSVEIDPDALVADPDSERSILEIPEPQGNHNAGAIAFGPDDHLYVGVGDGGGADDTGNGHVDDWYDDNAGGNGQDVTENLLGSILRIDVTDTGDEAYAVPDDNPLVGSEGLDEHFAWGFRNPWGMSFHEGELYVADVGQNRFEEIDHVRAGGNYGWNVREGDHCFSTDSPSSPPESCPTETADGDPLIEPVIAYPHSGQPISGVAVIGGYVYAGEAIPGLAGRYVFADWQADGNLFVGTPTDEKPWQIDVLPVDGEFGSFVLGFGRDPVGENYVCTTEQAQVAGSTGAVYRLTTA